MSATKRTLTSLYGRRVGLSQDNKLVVGGRTVPTLDDTGCHITRQGAPAVVDATATLTAVNLKAVIITSSTAAAVTGTLPTGALLDASFTGTNALVIGDAFDWGVINTGAVNTFTVAAGVGHTVVGNMVVGVSTTRRFRTRKTAASTFVTYAL